MSLCDNLISYVDGELDAPEADAFREHLKTCEDCPARLVEAVQLTAQLSTLRDGVEPETGNAVINEAAEAAEAAVVSLPVAPLPQPQPSDSKASATSADRQRVAMPWAAVAALVVLGVGIAYQATRRPSDAFARVTHRPYAVRLAHTGAAAHHPPDDPMLGAAPASSANRIPLEAIVELEKRGDQHGVAIATLWNDRKPGDTDKQLGALEQTEPVRSDRAAMEVLTTNAENAEPVLAGLEALRRSSDQVVARAARWNYALLLSRLDLPLSAAQAFEAIASEHEAGWSEEASKYAAQDRQRGNDFLARWQQADNAGKALIQQGTPVPSALINAVPGVLRAHFYDAVRAAQSLDRVRALAPMASQLDKLGDPDQRTLRDYVDRVAKLDFAQRGPLAGAYATLLRDAAAVAAPFDTQLLSETSSDNLADIVLGAMLFARTSPQHREWFQQRVNDYPDPWLQILLLRGDVDAAWDNSDWFGAERKLLEARKLCTPALSYQCLPVDRSLGKLYGHLHRIPESLRLLRDAAAEARRTGEWGRYHILLTQLSDVERFHAATATVRAYAGELLQLSDYCEDRDQTYRKLAGAAILDGDGRAARGYFAEAMKLSCVKRDLPLAAYFSDLAVLDPRPNDLAQLQQLLGTVRANPKLNEADRALTDVLEGRVAATSERDRATGVALLEKAIAAADTQRDQIVASKARAAAYNMLAFRAGNTNDHTAALGLVARDLRRTPPSTCTVAMAAESKQAVVVVRGADGKDRGRYFSEQSPRYGVLAVPAELARALAGCSQVGVMAPAALQGTPRVLPDDLAWGYTADAANRAAASEPPAAPRTLIVTNVTPPPSLELQPLSNLPPDTVAATTLSGAAATPSAVLAAMANATEIQFHTHALLDVGVSDASHLVLSSESPGAPYALTAEAIRKIQLRGQPTVALEACHSARGAHYEHAPWSLPDAFLAAGARAVFATATEIPDVASGEFFAKVLARVRAGAAPAVALRDERVATLRSDPNKRWVSDVIVFE